MPQDDGLSPGHRYLGQGNLEIRPIDNSSIGVIHLGNVLGVPGNGPAFAQVIDKEVVGDFEKPGPQGLPLDAIQGTKGFDEGFLGEIKRQFPIVREPVEQSIDPVLIMPDEVAECLAIAAASPLDPGRFKGFD